MKKAQVSVEFFLLLTLMLALAVLLYAGTGAEQGRARSLDRAAETRAFLERASLALRESWFEGNASTRVFSAFVPGETNCFYWNATSSALYCASIADGAFVAAAAPGLPEPQTNCTLPLAAGWREFKAWRDNAASRLDCLG
ncbi:MAG: hypothetical protein WC607_01485 [Candidatus Micrarchaeia archaeon]